MYRIKSFTLLLTLLMLAVHSHATDPISTKPKLVVGIVVDQMRYDYIVRYWDKFGEGGFKKLAREGFNCSNTQYNYVPTFTGPGHASIYTGTTPAVHGIISNNWYDRNSGRAIYVTDDSTMKGVGTTANAGKMSPANLLTTTFGDELRMASNFRSKVIAVALKDRSAILPAGHSANAAYWFESASGNFVSSSWYLKQLPAWVNDFNSRKLASEYLKKPWKTLLPIEEYLESTPDSVEYEGLYAGENAPVFPHNFPALSAANVDLLRYSPFGNVLTKEFALTAMKAENLGRDEFTDLLAVSFSSTDYVGHQFGTHAVETEDTYLRLDQDLAELIAQTEAYAGKGNVLFFLTADHAAIPNICFLEDHNIPSDMFNVAETRDTLQKFLATKYGQQKWLLSFINDQIYFDYKLLEMYKIKLDDICDVAGNFLMKLRGVAGVLTSADLVKQEYTRGIRAKVQNGFYVKRSGDLVIILEPGLVEYKFTGTDHGSGYMYDTHVPLLFYGCGISPGKTTREIEITDLAPTISQILNIQSPNGNTGKVIVEITDKK